MGGVERMEMQEGEKDTDQEGGRGGLEPKMAAHALSIPCHQLLLSHSVPEPIL